jgi:hypothetical protein
VTSVKPDNYTLQLNTNTFQTPACAGSPGKNCVGWQQFTFDQRQCGKTGLESCTYIQYWLLGWGGDNCPPGWDEGVNEGCFRNSPSMTTPVQTIADLGNMSLTGTATSGGMDAIIFSSGNNLYLVQVTDTVLSLAQGWTSFTYNIVGEGNGSAVNFNPGASFVVRLSVGDGSTNVPTCRDSFGGDTAEHNNLYLQPKSVTPTRYSTQPALVYTENTNQTTAVTTNCDAALLLDAAGRFTDTHDLNGDGFSDIVWRNTNGDTAIWLMTVNRDCPAEC